MSGLHIAWVFSRPLRKACWLRALSKLSCGACDTDACRQSSGVGCLSTTTALRGKVSSCSGQIDKHHVEVERLAAFGDDLDRASREVGQKWQVGLAHCLFGFGKGFGLGRRLAGWREFGGVAGNGGVCGYEDMTCLVMQVVGSSIWVRLMILQSHPWQVVGETPRLRSHGSQLQQS